MFGDDIRRREAPKLIATTVAGQDKARGSASELGRDFGGRRDEADVVDRGTGRDLSDIELDRKDGAVAAGSISRARAADDLLDAGVLVALDVGGVLLAVGAGNEHVDGGAHQLLSGVAKEAAADFVDVANDTGRVDGDERAACRQFVVGAAGGAAWRGGA